MYVKAHTVKVAFVTKAGVRIVRTFTLRDASRANAEYRAKRLLPQGATAVVVVR